MITVIVEGPGEQAIIPILARRTLAESVRIKCVNASGKANIIRRVRGFEDTLRRLHALGEQRFIILMDGDTTFEPYQSLTQEYLDMPRRATVIANELRVSVVVCWAKIETESWLIAGLAPGCTYCRLARVPAGSANTEHTPPDPKRWLKAQLRQNYTEHVQQCLATHVDLELARQRNASFATFCTHL
ncbi:DUF4276 family protein [Candidatus Chloroploca sp. Khr17]|uniref:DUF4276 family protein n=1 Tax=Candidatus Chloroploca sp. Khr17 TaxID=2496869 RepID=UPI00101C5516|nr:DUF4276 family protein [Candidatus Chloroploca sp. Khr17]